MWDALRSAQASANHDPERLLLRDVNARWMFPSKPTNQAITGLASLTHGIVTAVEVFALFELVLQEILLVGELAVQAEELLLLFGKLLS